MMQIIGKLNQWHSERLQLLAKGNSLVEIVSFLVKATRLCKMSRMGFIVRKPFNFATFESL